MSPTLPVVVATLELTLAAAGALLLWRIALRPGARRMHPVVRLTPWNATVVDFLKFGLFVLLGSFIAAIGSTLIVKYLPFRGDEVTVFNGAAAQLGMLLGVVAYRAQAANVAAPPPPLPTGTFISGVATFVIALPVLIATAKAWEVFLEVCGLPTEKQDLIAMFANADSAWMVTIMLALAIVIAPLTEELIFRAGLFRYFRTRMPHWVAVLAPAIFFATLHVNWKTLQGLSSLAPLTVLAMIFSLAYERTGRIGTAIVAHALFNLNTVVLIFSGVGV